MSNEALIASFAELAETTPKRPQRYVFMGENNGSFTGNTKHLFLYFAKNRPDVESCYFTGNPDTKRMLKDAGLPVAFFPDVDSVDTLVQASTVVVDSFDYKFHIYRPLTHGARIIQLWHGVGFKKIGLIEKESETTAKYNKLDLEFLYSGYDTVITTSDFYNKEVFKPSFNAKEYKVLGYPRNDALLQRPTKESMLNCDHECFRKTTTVRKEGRKTILYAPTFRDQTGSPVSGLDFQRLHDFLDREGLHLVMKAHRLTQIQAGSNLPYLSFYTNTCDVYPFIPLVDMMVTDYSSIYMDYLLLDRPVIFYCPDYEEYVTCNREFQFPYDDMTPGPKCRNQDEFHAALKKAATGDDGYSKQRQELRNKAFNHCDGHSSERIAEYLTGSPAQNRK
ncbi:CDP-Glycerol:Poly(Glycerophosphate) glycerophosphotransferase [Pseudodesulfovibrio profundus]|uniref:CDP-Glycerol:Poly(Glycerophosphate) glycerophosphotransferase n=1 Tax=Pseudodesulfovibrio profundus TaxID=57320 RepID=A0A2C8FA28_9BACT|nr:CDP-glycerol glycerophosphotransferase family protein [Pseudodesulfovibrio profundus]SOB58886.1 CDP-Glycerol:Poly(Glycerophosphate) glycerophosphotransferase [Pseudodesulfovibrio profundus]